ncbi:MAG: hypothetical protein Q9217_006526 [Psora testacea]
MARLNDPPQPAAESVDAQNVSLREQVIKLHYEVESNPGQSEWTKVDDLKQRLEARLTEFGGLLQELGDVQSSAARHRPIERKSLSRVSSKPSPKQRNWKTALVLSEVTGEPDGRLPPIPEDKSFPRRSLNGEALQGILADPKNPTDSPDLGPPPIAHFDEGGPIKFDPTIENHSSAEPAMNAFPANLENRKKRRESFHQKEPSRRRDGTDLEGCIISAAWKAAPASPLKTGAKRKLNIKEEDNRPIIDSGKDDFRFNRRSTELEPNAVKLKTMSKGKLNSSRGNEAESVQILSRKWRPGDNKAVAGPAGRMVLGPKSVNSDPQSPAKLATSRSKGELSDRKDDIMRRIENANGIKDKQTSVEAQKDAKETETWTGRPVRAVELLPDTIVPSGLDPFFSTVSDPPQPRPQMHDTPPPGDLGQDTGAESFGRVSRRPRGSVSYAEPNLRAKMRRPTKELVDAVGAEEKIRQASDSNKEGNVSFLETGLESLELKSTTIKLEGNGETSPVWRTKALHDSESQKERQQAETTNPLSKKIASTAGDLPASVITDRRRRINSISRKDMDAEQVPPSSVAAAAIAALAGAGPKARRRERDRATDATDGEEPLIEGGERTSIFDFTGSSLEDVDKKIRSKGEPDGPTDPKHISRRHSSVPANLDCGNGSTAISRRRRETMSGNEDAAKVQSAERPELKGVRPAMGLDGASSRGERAANRRRSMML